MKPARRKRPPALTELEGSVLGMIGSRGPCTPYAIRRDFQESPSLYWSASAGAVYPLIGRLKKQGLIKVKRTTGDGRGGNLYVLTPAGERALRSWLGPPCPPTTISVPPDPLRNRVETFAMLSVKERAAFLGDAIRHVEAYLRDIQAYTERKKADGEEIDYLVGLGAYRMTQARLEWLREAARLLGLKVTEENDSSL
jgi:DNA-binding PadR family transcriptional regulator